MKRIILAVLVGVLVLVLTGPTQSQQPPEVKAADQHESVIDGLVTRENQNPESRVTILGWRMKPTDILITVFTGLLTLTTVFLAIIAYGQHKASRVAERAYVKLSHQGPSLQITPPGGMLSISISVKNFGQTPARIIDTVLKLDVRPTGVSLPTAPNYLGSQKQNLAQAFLVTGDEYFHHLTFPIPTAQAHAVLNGTETCWLYGYVEYEDMFGKKHRGGYARVYKPQLNQFIYLDLPKYNYDCTL